MTARRLPKIAITMGDPAGVGPELCLRLLANPLQAPGCIPLIFGDLDILRRVAAATELPEPPEHAVVHLPVLTAADVQPGAVSAACGEAAYQYIQSAIAAAKAGDVAAVTTAPINKEALHAAGRKFPGHTEIFAEAFHAPRSCMMQYSEALTCSFVTVHVGYHEVPELLTRERILDVLELTADAIRRIRGHEPKLLVCGLNPHAGEHGLFGRGEEESVIIPALDDARARGLNVTGPVPPDTAFLPARRREFDAVVCMYHDQGHIPVKMLAFDSAVNITLGLEGTVRTSVDHGTAFDIAWQGLADPGSLFHAVRLATKLA